LKILGIIKNVNIKIMCKKEQAAGGAGLIFNLAKEKLGGHFSEITNAIPAVKGLMD
jgi:hypothetical protein